MNLYHIGLAVRELRLIVVIAHATGCAVIVLIWKWFSLVMQAFNINITMISCAL